ncbi:unnamed protein product [Cochlearia groenlandica]
MIIHTLLILSLFVSAAVTAKAATAAAYNPTDVFLFNCGDTSSNSIDTNGRNWTSEQRRILPSNLDDSSFVSNALTQGSAPRVPYMTSRIFRSAFGYVFPVSPGSKFIRLYFYPTRYVTEFDAVSSYFSVTVNGFTLLKNFSAYLTANASNSEFFVKEFIVDGNMTSLNLTFTPSPSSLAFVNGIEIVSMPDRFYSKGGFDEKIMTVGSDIDYVIANSTALESVYRLNVGGNTIGDVSDSGMFRNWVSDDKFLLGNLGIVPNILGVKISYSDETPAYVAPEDVYATSRSMGNPKNVKLNLQYNLTWIFQVDSGFSYLLRLHFCETLPDVTLPGQRIFSIFIGNQTAKSETDIIHLSGGSKIPVYLDFNIYVEAEGGISERRDLRLELHPFQESTPRYFDAILNGVEVLKQSDPEGNLAGPNPNPLLTPDLTRTPVTSLPRKRNSKSHVLAIVVSLIGSAVVLSIFVVFMFLFMKRKKKNKKSSDYSAHTKSKATTDSWAPLPTGSTQTRSTISLPSDLCRRFSILEIKTATNNFEEKLIVGVGGFGPVYKGRIDNGATLVAVKRLEITSSQGSKEFETELEMLSMLRHKHLVSLIGYCDDENEMVLVYEYMQHGTVRDHLYKRNKGSHPPLTWKQRLEICIGAARGIQYLHTGTKHTIIHRDIKTTNILLDENYVAKVSDFGLSRVGPTSASQSHVETAVKGTFGYLDPEYYRRQVLTEKSDVYSFGVVLFEVMCCRPVNVQNVPRDETDLVRWVKLNCERGSVDQIVDSDLTADITKPSLEKFCEVAVSCVRERGNKRPSMNDVVWTLEFVLQLHVAAMKKNNDDVESMGLTRRANENVTRGVEVGMTTEEDELFSRSVTGHVAKSSTTDEDCSPFVGGEKSGSSWGVFSEINEPKAR